jgi:hypothetical protein
VYNGGFREEAEIMSAFLTQTGRNIRASCTAVAVLATIGAAASIHVWAQTPPESLDKYQWLEDFTGERSLAWVKTANERAKALENDPRFAGWRQQRQGTGVSRPAAFALSQQA